MRLHEILGDSPPLFEAKPHGGVKPLTPAQMRARQKRKDKAAANLQDTRAGNALKLQKAQRKVFDV